MGLQIDDLTHQTYILQLKALIDGLTDGNLWTDDNHKVIKEMSFRYGGVSGVPKKFKFVLEVEEVEQ